MLRRAPKAAIAPDREMSITSEAPSDNSFSQLASSSLPAGVAAPPPASAPSARGATMASEFLCVTVREARNLVGKFQNTANP